MLKAAFLKLIAGNEEENAAPNFVIKLFFFYRTKEIKT